MRAHVLRLAMIAIIAPTLYAQVTLLPRNGGNATDGAFAVTTGTITLDTDVQDVYNFQSLQVSAGATLRIIGSRPCTIKVQGNVAVDGTIDCSGSAGGGGANNATGGVGGAGGPGGGAGGDGACVGGTVTGIGDNGQGASPGQGGIDSMGVFADGVGGGGGGGNATPGMMGGAPNSGSAINTSGAGGPAVTPVRAGSGGGGGACDIDSVTTTTSNDGGGGGGGGGGYISIYSDASIAISATGIITARGGDGGLSAGNGGGGGGGSGGAIDLVAPQVLLDGTLDATGGAGGAATQSGCGCSPGGAGGDGQIEAYGNISGTLGTVTPALTPRNLALMVTSQSPVGLLDINGASGDAYAVVYSGSLAPSPIMLPGFAQPVEIDLFDPIAMLNFPTNLLPAVFGSIVGTVAGTSGLNLSGFLGLGADFDLFSQGVTANAAGLSGVTPRVDIRVKL